MTQKSGTKPNSAAAGKVVVFGLDSNWRPHAAWFSHTQADQARAAAKQLRLNVIEVANGTAAELVTKLPAGQIHAAGPAMVPPVREDLYEKVVATINPRGEAGQDPGAPVVTDLPETWAAIKPGHLVLAQDSLVGGYRASEGCRLGGPGCFLTPASNCGSGCSAAARVAAHLFIHGEIP